MADSTNHLTGIGLVLPGSSMVVARWGGLDDGATRVGGRDSAAQHATGDHYVGGRDHGAALAWAVDRRARRDAGDGRAGSGDGRGRLLLFREAAALAGRRAGGQRD